MPSDAGGKSLQVRYVAFMKTLLGAGFGPPEPLRSSNDRKQGIRYVAGTVPALTEFRDRFVETILQKVTGRECETVHGTADWRTFRFLERFL